MRHQILCTLLLFAVQAYAQQDYSYVTDRIFADPSDLIGYNFLPNFMEIPDEVEEELSPGDYSFGVSHNNLYVAGEEIAGVYSINNINPTEYGYKLLLMNARNPMLQGHLKVILTPQAQVEAIVFKRSNNDQEMIFFLPGQNEQQRQREADYFTDRWELPIESADSLWGKTITPFLRIHTDERDEQERLHASDSTTISFVETIEIIEKIKKKKKRKSKKKNDKEEIEIDEAEESSNAKVSEEEVEEMREEALAATPPDSLALVAADSLEQGVKKKIKIVKKYFVNIRSMLTYQDGSTEDKTWSLPVKKIVEREDESAGPGEERYQLEIQSDKGDPVYLYLTSERTVSSVEAIGKRFLMQGH